jgi:integrase
MNTISKLKNFKSGAYEYLYVYFKYKGNLIRINTGQKFIPGMHKQDLLYNARMSDYKLLNRKIIDIKQKVDKYLLNKFQYQRPTVNQKECLVYLKDGILPSSVPTILIEYKKKNFMDFFNEFYQFKEIELQNKASLKDYKSLQNALLDYEKINNEILTFDLINDLAFWHKFRNFLFTKHPEKSLTDGDLNSNTVQKRISSLKTFISYIQVKKYYTFDLTLFKYKVPRFLPDFVTLDREEISQLENLQIDNNNWQKIIDVFICNCFMSLRFSDLQTFNKGEFTQDKEGDYIYTKINEKTNIKISVIILPTSLKILQKYDFKLPKYTNQYFNRELKKILEHYELFKQFVRKTEVKNGQPLIKEYLKRELISSHTCRRTFITNCISNNVSLNSIQAATGHTQLSALSKYVQRIANKEQLMRID